MLYVTAARLTASYTSCAGIRLVQRCDHFQPLDSLGLTVVAHTICDKTTRVRNSENEMQIAGL